MKEDPLNIVIGTISSVQKVENTERLYLVVVDTGEKKYQIATSLASFFEKKELIGKLIPIKIDVSPKKIMGVFSNARFIAILGTNNEPILLVPERRVGNGSIVM